ncbi:MAG: cysteine desulfurase [Candidatus Bathyarchaeota archaeon]|nr:cysteine desulfurase [Candidatus Bathyarchaeota archaeon]
MDYAATTPLDPRVLEAMNPYFTEVYGNASSINAFGLEAREALEDARRVVAGLMNAEAKELVFTGSATEANNLVLKGFAFRKGKEKAHIAISTIEHDCVLNSAKWLEKQDFRITYVSVDRYGLLDLGELEDALRSGASLVSIIHANNEIGTIQTLKEIGELCHAYGANFHTDAAQSFGKIPIDVEEMNIDLMTVNAHKIYGPKGVGALYIKKGVRLEPLLHGGGHEFGLRSGTENVPGIMGFAKAVELRREEMGPEADRLSALRDRLIKGTLEIEESYLNGHPMRRLPNIANFRFSYIEGESLVLLLNDEGVAASTGSACSSRSLEPSHVLLALGLKPEEVHGSLRISLGKYNTEEDVDYILDVLPGAVEKLRRISPLAKRGRE